MHDSIYTFILFQILFKHTIVFCRNYKVHPRNVKENKVTSEDEAIFLQYHLAGLFYAIKKNISDVIFHYFF